MSKLAPRNAEIKVNLVSLCVLMINALQGFANKDVGFEDTEETLQDFLERFSKEQRIHVTIKDLEQLLWAANLRAEQGQFWNVANEEGGAPRLTFDQFLQKFFRYTKLDYRALEFDRAYNVISFKEVEEGAAHGTEND